MPHFVRPPRAPLYFLAKNAHCSVSSPNSARAPAVVALTDVEISAGHQSSTPLELGAHRLPVAASGPAERESCSRSSAFRRCWQIV
jgi:hypothetical protein